jgi:ABC-type glycerol-3-phosphate transport system substrate-binding protein
MPQITLRILLAALLLWSVTVTGCADSTENGGETPQSATPPPVLTAPLTPPAGTTPQPDPPETEAITLRLWFAPHLAPVAENPGGEVLAAQLAAYQSGQANVSLDIQSKAVSGSGGMFSYLESAQVAAPDIMPDLMLISADNLPRAFQTDTLQPFTGQVGLQTAYPAARALGQLNDDQYGYPFALHTLHHLVTTRSIFPDSAPPTWDALTSVERTRLGFSIPDQAGVALLLQLYLNVGGTLESANGRLVLQENNLAKAFGRFQTMATAGKLDSTFSLRATEQEIWNGWLQGTLNVAVVNASTFLQGQARVRNAGFSLVPGNTDFARPLVGGYVWVLISADPERQQAAEALVAWLADPEQQGAWSRAAMLLPTGASALATWSADDPYTDFLNGALSSAIAIPPELDAATIELIRNGIVTLLQDDLSPSLPARQIVQELTK